MLGAVFHGSVHEFVFFVGASEETHSVDLSIKPRKGTCVWFGGGVVVGFKVRLGDAGETPTADPALPLPAAIFPCTFTYCHDHCRRWRRDDG
jgi:hypothetical protein